ncbi:MAG: CHAD domain-containing protein [Chthoniobacterales bacterium]
MNEKLQIIRRKYPGPQLKGILLHFLDDAENHVEGLAKNPKKHIHHLRTNMKSIRSALRLLDSVIDEKAQAPIISRIRTIKNVFAASRDAAVLLVTCRKLKLKPAIVKHLHLENALSGKIPLRTIRKIHREIRCLKKDISVLPLEKIECEEIQQNFSSSFKRAIKAQKRCRKDPAREHFHTWRKRVKDVWYQNQLMGKFDKGVKVSLVAAQLSDLLGDGNDLEILSGKIADSQNPQCIELRPFIEKRIRNIRRKTFKTAKKLF